MNFRTPVVCPQMPFRISHSDNCIFTGSCFAGNIGQKIKEIKIRTLVNPTGIHYNPLSLADSLHSALSEREIEESDLFFANGRWNHFNFHSEFSAKTKKDALKLMNKSKKLLKDELTNSEYLFVTFGTAIIYENSKTGSIVANCHKLPASTFKQRFVMPDETVSVWNKLISDINRFNPKLKIVFTVSPIRHFKNGATENQFSKSSLFIAIKSLLSENSNAFYFPAYEIVMDELRDYRFYANDMLHPAELGINYIWEKFSEVFFSPETIKINQKIEKILKATQHKVFDNTTEEYKKFCSKMLIQISELCTSYPELDFSEEIAIFKNG
ncbi:MAG: GSCFA domain-containing protein [Bacteroidales bacterium]|nr:GSCFA domain-containing protein [Bacteroidales bacterium]